MILNNFPKILIILSFYLFIPSLAKGAMLYLEPASGQFQPGDTFMVDLKIDTEGECINAVEANLKFSNSVLKAVDFSRGESILNLWVKNPEINQGQGLVSFSGGIPGGYCGRIPGDPGESNVLGRIIFKIPGMTVREAGEDSKENLTEIKFLENSRVLLNDGLGTEADLKTKGTLISIQPETGLVATEDEWRKELLSDNVPPEPFKIEIGKDPSIFDGRYFIVFSSADKQSGLDYFEVKEGKNDWKKAQSPCLLEDQSLKSIIKVKAVDKAGNERITEYMPSMAKPFPWWKIITIIVGLAIVGWIIKKYFLKKLWTIIH